MQGMMSSEKMIEMFTLKIISNLPIESITKKVTDACVEYKFSLLQTYIYQEILESKGFPIDRKVYIYEICQAKTASLMLTSNPEFSLFMPCKLAIYEHEGNTVISTMNMGIMLDAVSSNKELYASAVSLFNTLQTLMNALAV